MTEKQVSQIIRELHSKGLTLKSIGERHGVCKQFVSTVLRDPARSIAIREAIIAELGRNPWPGRVIVGQKSTRRGTAKGPRNRSPLIAELHAKGASVTEIANRHGVSKQFVSTVLRDPVRSVAIRETIIAELGRNPWPGRIVPGGRKEGPVPTGNRSQEARIAGGHGARDAAAAMEGSPSGGTQGVTA